MAEKDAKGKSGLFIGGLDRLSNPRPSGNDSEIRETTEDTSIGQAVELETSEGNRVLLAEDEKAISNVLSIKLKNSGFDVDVANNGKEAIELLSKKIYDVVLLDLIMPEVNGFEVLEHIKNSGNEVPTLVSSNLSQEEDIKKAKELGAVDYFVKSDMTLSEIVESVNKYKK